MLAKCANPSSAAKFLHLHDGAIFSIEPGAGAPAPKPGLLNGFEREGRFRRFQYFWLCPRCCKTMALRRAGERIVAVPRELKPQRIAAMETYGEEAA